jgi:uncharacterized protein (TIGR00255 family)
VATKLPNEKIQWQLHSMTGFGHAHVSSETFSLELSLRSVNSKSFSLNIKAPEILAKLEESLGAELAQNMSRGRLELECRLHFSGSGPRKIRFDQEQALALLEQLGELKHDLIEKKLTLGDLFKFEQLFLIEELKIDEAVLHKACKEALSLALADLIKARIREGKHLALILADILGEMAAELSFIKIANNDDVLKRYQTLKLRVEELFKDLELPPERIYQECAILVQRADFKEEIDRLHAHLAHFHEVGEDEGPKGRKLDFLCQEMLRETSTLMSKAVSQQVSKKGIALKALIERLREQVQNIE